MRFGFGKAAQHQAQIQSARLRGPRRHSFRCATIVDRKAGKGKENAGERPTHQGCAGHPERFFGHGKTPQTYRQQEPLDALRGASGVTGVFAEGAALLIAWRVSVAAPPAGAPL
jgi:hypothetical protein